MNALYISDLDGTLLNSNKQITSETAKLLNACIDKGLHFAVATARMAYACDYRLQDIRLNTPGILTNGVFIYDFIQKNYISVEAMTKAAALATLQCFSNHNLGCFLYTFADNGISLYYSHESLTAQTQYYSDKALEQCREVKQHSPLSTLVEDHNVVYLAATGDEATLLPINEALQKIPDIETAYYLNIYNGLYCLEVFSSKASKKNALLKLKKLYNFDEIVVFGDNLNDLSMIEIADRSYAPANALDVVKEQVTAVLEDCDHDGVAHFLAKELGI